MSSFPFTNLPLEIQIAKVQAIYYNIDEPHLLRRLPTAYQVTKGPKSGADKPKQKTKKRRLIDAADREQSTEPSSDKQNQHEQPAGSETPNGPVTEPSVDKQKQNEQPVESTGKRSEDTGSVSVGGCCAGPFRDGGRSLAEFLCRADTVEMKEHQEQWSTSRIEERIEISGGTFKGISEPVTYKKANKEPSHAITANTLEKILSDGLTKDPNQFEVVPKVAYFRKDVLYGELFKNVYNAQSKVNIGDIGLP